MKRIMALCACAFVMLLSTASEARPKHKASGIIVCDDYGCSSTKKSSQQYYEGAVIGGRPHGCPWRYCGCAVSLKVFGKIIPELNLAANWFRFPRTNPAPGMVAVRRGHVFLIQSVNGDGSVVAYDPNSGGHRTRVHTVSLRGYRVVDPRGTKMAGDEGVDKRNPM